NIVHDRKFSYGDPEAAFEQVEHTVEIETRYPRVLCSPMECYVVYAEYIAADDSFDVLANFQGPYGIHTVMARALGVPGSRFRLRTPPYSGGSFGSKLAVFPYVILAAAAARITGKPVKWVEDRLEHLAASGSGPERITKISAAVSDDGKVNALRCDHLEDYGAFLRAPMPGPMYRMHGVTTGAYDIPKLEIHNRIVLTHKVPVSLVRGFGGPQIFFALERLMHKIALTLQLDPLDVIKRNLVSADSFPHRTCAGALLDSGDYQQALKIAEREGRLEQLKQKREQYRSEGKLYGIGYAAVVEPSISNMGYLSTLLSYEEREKSGPKDGALATAQVHIDANGGISVVADSVPQGQGHRTVLAQVVADQLGVSPEGVTVNVEHDTQRDPWSVAAGNYASRFAGATAGAAHIAATRLRRKLANIAAKQFNAAPEAIEFNENKVFVASDPEHAIPFYRLVGSAHWSPSSLPDNVSPGLTETATWTPAELLPPDETDAINTSAAYGFIFDFCGVEVDKDTGEIRIDEYVSMHDAGRLLNPALANGQVLGSFAQAIGASLYEDFAYNADGSLLSGNFADYCLPTAHEVPEIKLLHMESPSPFTPLGAKGIGEGNCMSTPVCLANAVADAIGVEDIQLPMTPHKIAALLHGGENDAPKETTKLNDTCEHSINGTGTCRIDVSPEVVWNALLDPRVLEQVIPGCRRLELVGDKEYRGEAGVRIGPVNGEFQARVLLTDLVTQESMTLHSEAAGTLGSSTGISHLHLKQIGDGTVLEYDYGLSVSGKLAAVGGRMLESSSRYLIKQFFDSLSAYFAPQEAKTTWWQRLLNWLRSAS
ncbi:MAG: molybdopterin-dependent oxidoreductase, partial [Gammaproteobacteria bacterium]|nr:molybdopterin-dependent oxidoreductase [Gammaproteobacteria bacterium]